jgi:hypothetical protein
MHGDAHSPFLAVGPVGPALKICARWNSQIHRLAGVGLDHNVISCHIQYSGLCKGFSYVSCATFVFSETFAARLLHPSEQSNLEISQLQTSARAYLISTSRAKCVVCVVYKG